MLTLEEFASLLLIGTPSTYGPPTVVPPEHSARLIALGYMADIGDTLGVEAADLLQRPSPNGDKKKKGRA